MDQQDLIEIVGKLLYAASIIVVIVLIALIWYKITGHSPTADQMIITLQSGTIAAIFGFIYYFAEFKGSTKSDIRSLQRDVFKLQQSWSDMQKEAIKSQAKISSIQDDVSEIKRILSKKRAV